MGIMAAARPKMAAIFAVKDNWDGVGGWTLGTHHVEDVPVKSD